MAREENGVVEGYGVDFLNEIAKHAGYKYEYVYASWADCLTMLKERKIDMVCTAKFAPERAEFYDFVRQSIGSVKGMLYVRNDNADIYYEDFNALNGKRIAFIRENLNTSLFEEYAQQHNFTYQTELYDDDAAMTRALLKKQVDAIATEQIVRHDNLKLVAQFGNEPFYIMLWKDSPHKRIIENALREIESTNVSFQKDLFERHYSGLRLYKTFPLTRDEAAYMASCGVITVGTPANRHPFSSYDPKNETLFGINEDIILWIEKLTGLKFDMRPLSRGENPIEALKKGQLDIVAGALKTEEREKDPSIVLSSPFNTSTLSIVKRKEAVYAADAPQTLALKKSLEAVHPQITKKYPHYSILYRYTDIECLDALLNGKADITLQNVYVGNYLLQKPKYQSLELLPIACFEDKECFAVLNGTDARLMSILNKAISMLPEATRNEIILKNTIGKPYAYTWEDAYYKFRIPFWIIGLLVVVCLSLFIPFLHNRQKNLLHMAAKNLALVEAAEQARTASRAKGDFLSRMSHEIRTPLNAIIGMTTLAREHAGNRKAILHDLDKVSLSSRILLSIINDVLDMASIESGKTTLSEVPFDFKQMLSSITDTYCAQCRQKGILFETCVLTPVYQCLVGDQLRLQQILVNLLSNAVKFTKQGSICLTVEQQPSIQGKTFVRFTVKDTGCGIPEEMQKRLFQPLEQEKSLPTHEYGGNGLGLALVKNLVTLMGGFISVESEKGKGSVFTVEIPFGCCEEKNMEHQGDIRDLRILVVDDERDTRDYTSLILARIGTRYHCVASGKEALEELARAAQEEDPYDVCIVDWEMPTMDGIEVTRHIRKCYGKKTIVIVASAYEHSEIKEKAIEAGADMFVTKPLFQSALFDLLLSLCGDRRSPDASQPLEHDFSRRRVLLVEDNETSSTVGVGLLNMAHTTVEVAANGKEALDMYLAAPAGYYDAILMDIQMPVMNGYEATRAIRSSGHEDAGTIAIIAMTANAFTEDIDAALENGMNAHVAKPIDLAILLSTLDRHFPTKT